VEHTALRKHSEFKSWTHRLLINQEFQITNHTYAAQLTTDYDVDSIFQAPAIRFGNANFRENNSIHNNIDGHETGWFDGSKKRDANVRRNLLGGRTTSSTTFLVVVDGVCSEYSMDTNYHRHSSEHNECFHFAATLRTVIIVFQQEWQKVLHQFSNFFDGIDVFIADSFSDTISDSVHNTGRIMGGYHQGDVGHQPVKNNYYNF
jgi:hypothetical protein